MDPFSAELKPRPAAPKRAAPKKSPPNLLILGAGIVILIIALAVGAYFLLRGESASLSTAGGDTPRSIVLEPTEKVIFSGKMAEITAAQGNTIQQKSGSSDNATVVIRSTNQNARPVGSTGGAFVAIPAALMTELAGKRVRITAWARAADQKPSDRFALAFTAGDNISSGWLVFTPGRSFQPSNFDIMIPKETADKAYIGVWSDISGQDGGIELRLLTARPIQ